jgi:2'-5' RNA ligase
MDAADAPESEGVMIALLPANADWCKIALPHLTLVYAGVKSDLKPTQFNELAKDTAMLAALSFGLGLRVAAREKFGSAGEVDAFRLQPTTELWAMRRAVERWNASEHPFNPHVTIGPAGTPVEIVPQVIYFDRMYLGWGDESLTFWLKR